MSDFTESARTSGSASALETGHVINGQLKNILACPDCRIKLAWLDDGIHCPECHKKYPVVNGVPVLFSKYSEKLEQQGIRYFGEDTEGQKIRKRLPSFARRFPSTLLTPFTDTEVYHHYVVNAPESTLILNLGSGNEKTGTSRRLNEGGTVINLDIFPHDQTHVVADGHSLPFTDESFDGVYMIAVIEHVANPFRVAGEVARVLKRGGFVLITAPFIYPRHSSPGDYFRFTDDGLRQLFTGFREIECAPHGLPTRGLLEFLKAYAAAFSDNKYFSYALSYFISYLLFPLKYLDKYLRKNKNSLDTCSSYYYVGIKESPLVDELPYSPEATERREGSAIAGT